jgi:mannose-6-phosphate isomerase-like protein (cupin superfamily)
MISGKESRSFGSSVWEAVMDNVELITANGQTLCYVIRAKIRPRQTTFITPPEAKQQVGFIVYPKDSVIPRHIHKPLERHIIGMAEVLVVRSGHCQIEVYDEQKSLVTVCDLYKNDVVLMVGGGHGFQIKEDTVLLEIKQGPYLGADDKELF